MNKPATSNKDAAHFCLGSSSSRCLLSICSYIRVKGQGRISAAMQAFIGPLNNRGDQQAAVPQAVMGISPGSNGHGRGYGLLQPWRFARRPRQSYNTVAGNHRVRVSMKKKCFIIRRSPPAVVGCRNRVNRHGDLTIGFGHGRPVHDAATLSEGMKGWKLVLDVLGIGENGMPNLRPKPLALQAQELEYELFGSSADEDEESDDDESDTQMPSLMASSPYPERGVPFVSDAVRASANFTPKHEADAEQVYLSLHPPIRMPSSDMSGRVDGATANGRAARVTAGSLTDDHDTGTPEPQAVDVSAGSSGDVPGSSYAGQLLRLRSTFSVVQPPDTYMPRLRNTVMTPVSSTYPQVTTGVGKVSMHIASSRCSMHIVGRCDRYCKAVLPRDRPIDIVTQSMQIAVVRRAWDLHAYKTADIVQQPDSEFMLTHPGGPEFFHTPCRAVLQIWHKPFYLRLMLAAWRQVAALIRLSFYPRGHNRKGKKPRTE